MALQRFDFPYHQTGLKYPDRNPNIKLGNNWAYTVRPHAPASREFILKFPLLKWFEDAEIAGLETRFKQLCANLLEDFYAAHETHEPFIYAHPRHGDLIVRFMEPINIPPGKPGDNGCIKEFQIILKEQIFN